MNPATVYDALIDPIDTPLTITRAVDVGQWVRVDTEESVGTAYSMSEATRPLLDARPLDGQNLADAAARARSWNLREASFGVAALAAWYSHPDNVAAHGFEPMPGTLNWGEVFQPFREEVAGRKVAVIGHFPFALPALGKAADFAMIERHPKEGDYPDAAAEYLLPDCDWVFISGSAMVNKTMPRLLELAADARTVLIGPSTPLAPVLFDHGVDVLTGLALTGDGQMQRVWSGL